MEVEDHATPEDSERQDQWEQLRIVHVVHGCADAYRRTDRADGPQRRPHEAAAVLAKRMHRHTPLSNAGLLSATGATKLTCQPAVTADRPIFT